jgi:hypothetical protein
MAEVRMPKSLLVRLLVVGSLALASSRAAADSVRCDGGIVSVGDSKLDLLGKCGLPTLREVEPFIAPPEGEILLPIERWTYNFGPGQFIQIVSLRGGKVIAIERGSYGYALPEPPKDAANGAAAIPRAGCEPEALRVGDRTLDVLARCGEPALRELRQEHLGRQVIEVWAYDFGPRAFVRYLEFEGGRLARIKTGGYGYSR